MKSKPSLEVRARTQEGLVAAASRSAEALMRARTSGRVLVVYDEKSARLYVEPRASVPRRGGRSLT